MKNNKSITKRDDKTASQSTINLNNQLVSTYSTQTSACSQTVAPSTIKCLLLDSHAPTNLPADMAPAFTYTWSNTPGWEQVKLQMPKYERQCSLLYLSPTSITTNTGTDNGHFIRHNHQASIRSRLRASSTYWFVCLLLGPWPDSWFQPSLSDLYREKR